MKKFSELLDAEEWADDNNLLLSPIGTYTGEERIVEQVTVNDTHIAVWERFAEYTAESERGNSQFVIIKEYIVVSTTGDHKEIDYADDYNDAMEHLGFVQATAN